MNINFMSYYHNNARMGSYKIAQRVPFNTVMLSFIEHKEFMPICQTILPDNEFLPFCQIYILGFISKTIH